MKTITEFLVKKHINKKLIDIESKFLFFHITDFNNQIFREIEYEDSLFFKLLELFPNFFEEYLNIKKWDSNIAHNFCMDWRKKYKNLKLSDSETITFYQQPATNSMFWKMYQNLINADYYCIEIEYSNENLNNLFAILVKK